MITTTRSTHTDPTPDPRFARQIKELHQWSVEQMPPLNNALLAREMSPDELVSILQPRLTWSPAPETLRPAQVKQLIVLLGWWGSSLARHRQENQPQLLHTPHRCFEPLTVGTPSVPFIEYFHRLARRVGHPRRVCLASMIRWNLPPTRVRWQGETVYTMPSAFDDGRTITFTDTVGELRFLELLKKCESVEVFANRFIRLVHDQEVAFDSPDALDALRSATTLLAVVRALMQEFGTTPPPEGLDIDHFLDVQRQFGVHWEVGDVPASAAQDTEFLKRDLIFGLEFPDYHRHVRRMYPALLDTEQQALTALMARRPLPLMLLDECGLTREALAAMPAQELLSTAHRHPQLVACHELLRTSAKLAGTHLRLIMKFLFKPMKVRAAAGTPDSALVTNYAGTTGMVERHLTDVTNARKTSPLADFDRLDRSELRAAAGLPQAVRVTSRDLPEIVHFVLPTGTTARLPR